MGGGGCFHDTHINASQDVNNSTIQRQDNSLLNVNISFLFSCYVLYFAISHDILFRALFPGFIYYGALHLYPDCSSSLATYNCCIQRLTQILHPRQNYSLK